MYIQMYIYGGNTMKTIPFTDFRKNASGFINEVEHGETLILVRRGKPVAEIVPFTGGSQNMPSWKQPGVRLQIQGSDLSSAILEDREAST
jgi:prevent-host-death family protein